MWSTWDACCAACPWEPSRWPCRCTPVTWRRTCAAAAEACSWTSCCAPASCTRTWSAPWPACPRSRSPAVSYRSRSASCSRSCRSRRNTCTTRDATWTPSPLWCNQLHVTAFTCEVKIDSAHNRDRFRVENWVPESRILLVPGLDSSTGSTAVNPV